MSFLMKLKSERPTVILTFFIVSILPSCTPRHERFIDCKISIVLITYHRPADIHIP